MEFFEWVSTCSVLWQDHGTMVISKQKNLHSTVHLVVLLLQIYWSSIFFTQIVNNLPVFIIHMFTRANDIFRREQLDRQTGREAHVSISCKRTSEIKIDIVNCAMIWNLLYTTSIIILIFTSKSMQTVSNSGYLLRASSNAFVEFSNSRI